MARVTLHQELFDYDKELRKKYPVICGIDEAGRGPLAGDVYAAAVILNDNVVDANLPAACHVQGPKGRVIKSHIRYCQVLNIFQIAHPWSKACDRQRASFISMFRVVVKKDFPALTINHSRSSYGNVFLMKGKEKASPFPAVHFIVIATFPEIIDNILFIKAGNKAGAVLKMQLHI